MGIGKSPIFSRLSLKLILILFVLILGLFFLYSTICSHFQQNVILNTVQMSAVRSGDYIRYSLHRMMLLNDRENLHATIQLLGQEPGIQRIRIYNKIGQIRYSSQPEEVGQIVDMKAEACYACHSEETPFKVLPVTEKARIFKSPADGRILGLIVPIYNSTECSNAACHAHSPDKPILGVLDVQMSLTELDQSLKASRRKVYSIWLFFLISSLFLILIIVYFMISRPIHKLQEGTVHLAAGDLAYRIQLDRRDELGDLAQSFNYMAENLQRAYNELKEWSNRLEERVKEKTEELEAIHREILQVERMASLGKMAATVAHELNNPLAGIVNYSKLLHKRLDRILNEDPNREKIIRDLELIRDEAMRCGNIVKDLLIFARGSKANFQPGSLNKIVEKALSLVRHHMELANIQWHFVNRLDVESVVCDSDQLMQALVALLVNAIEAMPEGGEIRIEIDPSERNPDAYLIKIQDTGVGIPEEIRDKIFEPFFSTKRGEKGAGLGLAVVYGIVQRHHGNIWVESTPGKGSTFYLELPMNPQDSNSRLNNSLEKKEEKRSNKQ